MDILKLIKNEYQKERKEIDTRAKAALMDLFYQRVKKLNTDVIEMDNKTYGFYTGTYSDVVGEVFPDGRITIYNSIDRDTLAYEIEGKGNSDLCNQSVELIIEVIEHIDKELKEKELKEAVSVPER